MAASSEVPKQNEPALLPQHAGLIAASGIAPAIAAARGYHSVSRKAELRRLGFADTQCRVPALLIPIRGVTGEVVSYQIRPDEPRVNREGKAVKYETPRGSRMALDVPPAARPWLGDPAKLLFITEGARKADAAVSRGLCCVALLGVWNWRGSNEDGGKVALPDWESVALNARDVYIAFDSDVTVKPAVQQAMARLKAFLEQRSARVRLIYLPPAVDGGKVGLDDFLAAGNGVEELLALASDTLRPVVGEDEGGGAGEARYRQTKAGLVWLKPTSNGVAPTSLTNFTAKIVGQVVEDDGAEQRRLLKIEAHLNGQEQGRSFEITAAEFRAMNWPMTHLGTGAVVYAGFGLRDHVPTAVQLLSGEVGEQRVYTHTGWREIGGAWCYLHAGGGIGPDGPVQGVEVRLPEPLVRFELPQPPAGDHLVRAIRASLVMLETVPDAVAFPVFCTVWRAALGSADFSVHLTGPTGAGKTEEAALAQQHWGSDMDARHLSGSWSSTGNALEGLAFAAQHALLVVDDFAPTGTAADVSRTHREADRLFRGQGNASGRLRMRSDASLKPAKPPRGLILSTGEDVPRGQSLRARVFVVELSPDALNWSRLTSCQEDARGGLYAEALAGFVRWLSPRYAEVQAALRVEVAELRRAATQSAGHRRTPEIVASLAVGLRYFLAFAQNAGVLSAEEADVLWKRGWEALGEAAAAQAAHQGAAEATRRFIELIRAAISSGRAHVAGREGGEPEQPGVWGWREIRSADGYPQEWRPQGDLVGWVDGEDLYLEPEASYAAAQRLARDTGDSLAVTSRTLHKRLHERHLLASTEPDRDTLTVRRMLAGSRRAVLHLRAASVMPRETAQPAQDGEVDAGEAPGGQLPGQFEVPPRQGTAHTNCPGEAEGCIEGPGEVGLGRLGSSAQDETDGGEAEPQASGAASGNRPSRTCYACGEMRFWLPVNGGPFRCGTCHPPATPDLVAEWLDVNGGGAKP